MTEVGEALPAFCCNGSIGIKSEVHVTMLLTCHLKDPRSCPHPCSALHLLVIFCVRTLPVGVNAAKQQISKEQGPHVGLSKITMKV